MVWSERLIKPVDSWLFAKSIEVECMLFFFRGKALTNFGGASALSMFINLRILKKRPYKQTVSEKVHCQKGNSPAC